MSIRDWFLSKQLAAALGAACLLQWPAATGAAETLSLAAAFDILEVDCSTAPAICAAAGRLRPFGSKADLAELLEYAAEGHAVVSHTQLITPGTPIEQVTEAGGIRFEIALALTLPEPGRYSIELSYGLQRQGEATAGSTSLSLLTGEGPIVVGGLSQSSSGPGGGTLRAGRITLILLEISEDGTLDRDS